MIQSRSDFERAVLQGAERYRQLRGDSTVRWTERQRNEIAVSVAVEKALQYPDGTVCGAVAKVIREIGDHPTIDKMPLLQAAWTAYNTDR